jgi:hypothetical protein
MALKCSINLGLNFSKYRLIWTALVAASLSAFTYYSFMIYMRWHEEPIVMNLDDKLAEIHEIPFPAVRVSLISIKTALYNSDFF